jgi:tetratricopeptide (TPR) repeat protein
MKLLVLLVMLLVPAAAHAQGYVSSIARAQAHFNAGEHAEAAGILEPLFDDETLPRADRAETYRLYGLSLFFLGRRDEADAMLFEFLKLEPEARLDPALVPPDGIAFFEGVRSRHASELRAYRKKPKRRHVIVSFLPPFGQFQNDEDGKAWSFATIELLLLATHVTTYFILEDQCHEDFTCDDTGNANTLKTVNLVSGVAFLATVAYGAYDGYSGFRRRSAIERMAFTPAKGGGMLGFSLQW